MQRGAVTHSLTAAALLSGWFGCTAQAAQPPQDLAIAGATVQLDYPAAEFQHGDALLLEWVRRSGSIVAALLWALPGEPSYAAYRRAAGDGVHGGKTFATPAAFIRVGVGREVTARSCSPTGSWCTR